MTTPSDLEARNRELEERLAEAEEALRAIRSGEVDAIIAEGPAGDQIFTLQGAETPYRILVEEMSQGALMLVPDGTILYANSRFASLSKTPLEQIIGASWGQFFSSEEYRLLQSSLQDGEPSALPEKLTLLAPDGSSSPVHLSLRSMIKCGVPGFSVIVTDLSERKRCEDALRKNSSELLDINKKLESFSYSISHDMRAPLRAMQGFGKILLDEYQDQLEPEARSFLGRIVTAAEQLDRMIQEVLAYSRSTLDETKSASLDLDDLIRETVQAYPNLRAANIEIVPFSGYVRCSAAPLRQCILNLFTNAIKFVPLGRVPVIKAWTESSDGRLRLWIQDNGIGILQEDQERIFNLLTRVHGDEQFEGTGLGLNMVKTAVEKMGGRVGVQSELGQGSRFWIELESALPLRP